MALGTLNCQFLKYIVLNFNIPQTVWVVAAAVVAQSHVALNWEMLLVIGSKQKHTNGHEPHTLDWRGFITTYKLWVFLVDTLKLFSTDTQPLCSLWFTLIVQIFFNIQSFPISFTFSFFLHGWRNHLLHQLATLLLHLPI